MKAQSVFETQNFLRGVDSKKALGLGLNLYLIIIREDYSGHVSGESPKSGGTAYGTDKNDALERFILNEWADGVTQLKNYRKAAGKDADIQDFIYNKNFHDINVVGTSITEIDLTKETNSIDFL